MDKNPIEERVERSNNNAQKMFEYWGKDNKAAVSGAVNQQMERLRRSNIVLGLDKKEKNRPG